MVLAQKIGAFIINMLGDKTVLTLDHVTESMDRMFGPNQAASVDIPALHKFMMEEMELTEADILKIEQENDWIAFEQEGLKDCRKSTMSKKVISWLKNTGATRIGGVCNKPKKGSKRVQKRRSGNKEDTSKITLFQEEFLVLLSK